MDLCEGCRKMTLRHYLTDQRSQKHALREKISGYYLVLLSIYQTCRYKEIRFLDFLLSKARDIDRFVAMNESIKTRRRMPQEPLPHSMLRMGQPSSEEVGDGGLATLGEHQRCAKMDK